MIESLVGPAWEGPVHGDSLRQIRTRRCIILSLRGGHHCVYTDVAAKTWVMWHMDDYLFVGPKPKLVEMTTDMSKTMLLRDMVF